MVGNVIGVWLRSRQSERWSTQRRPPIPEKEVRRFLRSRENEDRLFGASGTNDSAALSLA
jgi:hypothetical protein